MEIARRDGALAWYKWDQEARDESRICQICLQEYNHNDNIPEVIACGRICCRQCLAELTEEIDGQVVTRCAVCRRYTKKPETQDFATSFALLPRLLPPPPPFIQL